MNLQASNWRPPADRRRHVPIYHPAQRPISPSGETLAVIERVAGRYGLTLTDMTSGRRSRYYAYARQEAMWHVRKERPHLSLPAIGRIFGGRDHSTVFHGIHSHEARVVWAEILIALGNADNYQPDLFARAA